MFIPVNTDAPINHFPAATIGLIVTNVVVFVITGAGFRPDLADPWILWFGAIRPYQWLTAFFMHAGFAHLIGNMIFLWAFGLVVEGKLGWKVFLPLYLAVGVTQCSVEQFIMLGSDREAKRQEQVDQIGWLLGIEEAEVDDQDELIEQALVPLNFQEDWEDDEFPDDELGEFDDLEFESRREKALAEILKKQPILFGALGASGAIYSLLAMSLVWAPKNCMTVVTLLGLRPISFEVTIMFFSAFYIGWDLLVAAFGGFAMSTAFLHTMGAITGGIFGVVMFKAGKVDCEDWDLFSVLSGNYGPHVRDIYGYRNEKGRRTKYDERPEDKPKKKKKSKLAKINELIDAGEYLTAAEDLFSLKITQPRAKLDEDQHRELGMGLVGAKFFEEAEAVLEDYIDEYPETANWACLRLAAVQFQENGQPRAAMRTLKKVNRAALTKKERETGRKLSRLAKQQIDAGVEDRETEW